MDEEKKETKVFLNIYLKGHLEPKEAMEKISRLLPEGTVYEIYESEKQKIKT